MGDLVAREPQLDRDVVFGIRAFGVVEDRLADHLMDVLAGRTLVTAESPGLTDGGGWCRTAGRSWNADTRRSRP